jgi:hypothetical protein
VILSNRERTVGILTAAVLGILALDRLALTPMMERKQDLEVKTQNVRDDLARVSDLFQKRRAMGQTWREMVAGGLKTEASEAESQALQALEGWAREARLNVTMLKQEGTEKQKPYQVITFRASGTGTMDSVSRFLYKVQQSKMPLRIEDMTITSRKEGSTDDLTVTLGVSTIFLPPDAKAPAGNPVAALARAAGSELEARQ